MVSYFSLSAMVITMLISFLLPVILFILLRRGSKNVTGAFIAGAVAFYISQMLIRIPMIQVLLPRFNWYRVFKENTLLLILFLALSAALFEETVRYLTFKLLLKERQVWKCGLAYGIGHGGIEAALIVGITYVNNIILSIIINRNTLAPFLRGKVEDAMAERIYKGLTETPPGVFLAAGVERLFVVFIHIALSVLILEGIVRKHSLLFYLTAVVAHAALNFVSAYLIHTGVNYWFVELFIGLFAVSGVIYIVLSKKRFGDKIEAEDEAQKALKDGY